MLQRHVFKDLEGITTTQQLKFHCERLPQINKIMDSMNNNRCQQVWNNKRGAL